MKKLTPNLNCTLRPVALYLEDVQIVLDLANELGVGIRLEDGDHQYEFSDAEDMKGLAVRSIGSLTITDNYPSEYYFGIYIFESHVTLRMREIDNAAYGIFMKIESFLRSKQRHSNWFIDNWIASYAVSLVAFVGGLLAYSALYYTSRESPYIFSALCIMVSGSLIMLASFHAAKNLRTIIHIGNRPEQMTTWLSISRRLDIHGALQHIFRQAIWAILCAIGGALMLYLYQHWHNWFKP